MFNFQLSSISSEKCCIKEGSRILVGVSGGVDSIYLLYQLYQTGQSVSAAVFDHGLRPEAAEECRFVKAFCEEREIPCFCGKADVSGYAAENGLGIEEAARRLRYRFLFQTAAEQGCAAVATAHHANDQAETVLMHILRGTGTDGLSGMRPYELPNAFSETIPLIRPLLEMTRKEIEKAALEAGLTWCEDCSNRDPAFTRNRIRLDLIPRLEADYNPQIVRSLCRLAETAAADKEVLDGDCDGILRYAAFRLFDEGAEWSRNVYRSVPEGLRLRMLRMVLSRMKVDQSDIGYLNLKEADKFFVNARYNQRIPFSGGLWLQCEGKKSLILKKYDIKQWKYPQFSQGWMLVCETRTVTEKELPAWMEKARLHPETAILDAMQVADYPILRKIRPGDRFEPYGMGGRSQKLSDFLVNNKVPKEYRPDLLVAADEGGIIWVPGLRVSNRCALGKDSRHLMILRLSKGSPSLCDPSESNYQAAE